MKIRRTQFVATIWTRAATPSPSGGLDPFDYGWHLRDNVMQPLWFHRASRPPANTRDCEDNSDEAVDYISDDKVWSEESDEVEN